MLVSVLMLTVLCVFDSQLKVVCDDGLVCMWETADEHSLTVESRGEAVLLVSQNFAQPADERYVARRTSVTVTEPK